ncbi:carcinine hydrolase/isopenicillin-N N-acyltransferase family protein [Apibacter raozihei]|uniref:carcinine hydrolase/isopenicillin-N N-acyltransferase family protein n=1 Tax=Apibacter raozihei TaxID=2500547 RepID=UPI000FE3E857|nr:carcinine hydrolase/isopenicillin-N N-acyltransferase family protein [Apibacter raozihei]
MKKNILVVFTLFIMAVSGVYSFACTTAVISGKATPDGRPLLYKNRDTPSLHSRLIYSDKGKYTFIGMVNPNDIENKQVLNGHNSAGFAIMNSDSYNINSVELKEDDRQDGEIMRLALETCATLKDFENLLNSLPKPLKLSSNFGVIDANGGAAYYETGINGFVKFDANNPQTAPFGYIIRTNYSFSGDVSKGKGYSRYLQAQELIYNGSLSNSLTPKYFMQNISRSLVHGLTKTDLNQYKETYAAFRDFIPRYYTASSVIFQGVKPGESPSLTTAWTVLGSTLGSVTIPIWINGKKSFPKILTADSKQNTPMDQWATQIKNKLFPIERGEGNDYIQVPLLLSVTPQLISIENSIFDKSSEILTQWYEKGKPNEQALQEFYSWIDSYVTLEYKNRFLNN